MKLVSMRQYFKLKDDPDFAEGALLIVNGEIAPIPDGVVGVYKFEYVKIRSGLW